MKSPLLATLSLAVLTFIAPSQALLKGKCLALALSGGANKGAYQAGVLHGLSHLLPEDQV